MNPDDPENVVFSRLPTASEELFRDAKSLGKSVIDRYANAARMGKDAIKKLTAKSPSAAKSPPATPATTQAPGLLKRMFSSFRSTPKTPNVSPTYDLASSGPALNTNLYEIEEPSVLRNETYSNASSNVYSEIEEPSVLQNKTYSSASSVPSSSEYEVPVPRGPFRSLPALPQTNAPKAVPISAGPKAIAPTATASAPTAMKAMTLPTAMAPTTMRKATLPRVVTSTMTPRVMTPIATPKAMTPKAMTPKAMTPITTPKAAPVKAKVVTPKRTAPKATFAEKFDTLKEKIQNNRNIIYYLMGIVVAISFIVFGSVLMAKKVKAKVGTCESGDCYATADGYGNITLTKPDPNLNDNSNHTKGLVMLLFGVACLCLVLVLYFRKQ